MIEGRRPACLRVLIESRMLGKVRRLAGSRNGMIVPCLLWTAAQSKGGKRPSSGPYGSIWIPGHGSVRAHVAAAWLAGLIDDLRVPDGFNIDHMCERTLCVEPSHFEMVPKLVNQKRRWKRDSYKYSQSNDPVPGRELVLRGFARVCEG